VAPAYQSIIAGLPRFALSSFPSPLHRVERLEHALRDLGYAHVPRIYFKRDDQLSLGLGGNKIRNLEFLIGQALAVGATDVITEGRQQSNHCRLTAAACAKAGLRAHLVLTGDQPARFEGNLLLDRLFGANVYFTGSDDREARQARVHKIVRTLEDSGAKPFTVQVGGSDARGAVGHVLLAEEIVDQMRVIGEDPSAIVLATATGGTQAGLLTGTRALGLRTSVLGFAVAKTPDELQADVSRLVRALEDGLRTPSVAEADIRVDGRALGDGYGVQTAEAQDAIRLLARNEGVLADPVYTGKGLAGFMEFIRSGAWTANEAVVFVHTGGAPALFVR
jgi:1-aminocyclopropane-1-carboxylate deaminase/D-cysteine desulfhydrase-like pyridoxal-dependent ACC family enzyme